LPGERRHVASAATAMNLEDIFTPVWTAGRLPRAGSVAREPRQTTSCRTPSGVAGPHGPAVLLASGRPGRPGTISPFLRASSISAGAARVVLVDGLPWLGSLRLPPRERACPPVHLRGLGLALVARDGRLGGRLGLGASPHRPGSARRPCSRPRSRPCAGRARSGPTPAPTPIARRSVAAIASADTRMDFEDIVAPDAAARARCLASPVSALEAPPQLSQRTREA
jgi:hypothetical protein